jgi:hypothetical protein
MSFKKFYKKTLHIRWLNQWLFLISDVQQDATILGQYFHNEGKENRAFENVYKLIWTLHH